MVSDKLIKAINYCFYGVVILVPLIYFPTTFYPFNIVKVVVFQILVELAFALYLGLAIFHPAYRPKKTPLLIALGIFLAALLLSTFFGVDWRASLWSDEQRVFGVVGIMHLLLLFLVATSLRDKIDWRRIFLFSFGTAVLVSIVGISQKFIYALPKNTSPWLYIIYTTTSQPHPLDRIGSTFSNSSFLAGYLLFNLFLGSWLIKSRLWPAIKNWILWIGVIVILIAVFLTQTLGALFGLGLGVLFLLLYYVIKGKGRIGNFSVRSIALACLALTVILGIFVFYTRGYSFWNNIPGFSRVSGASFKSASIHDRLLAWNIALTAFKDHPLFGWGPENFRIAYDRHYNPEILTSSFVGTNFDKPHDVILEYLTDGGIIGLLSYILLWGAAAYCLFRIDKSGSNQYTGPIFGAMLLSYLGQNLFVFDTIGPYLMFFLALGFLDHKYKELALEKREVYTATSLSQRNFKIVVAVLVLLVLVPIYYNYEIFSAAASEYWGVNYMLNSLPESSLLSFKQATATPTPYLDDIEKNFADTVRQASGPGINLSVETDLQNEIIAGLKGVINRHPLNFYNSLTLAEFEAAFYQSNPSYLDDAEVLLRAAINYSPNRQQIYYPLAKIKVLKGDAKAAYDILNHLVSLNPMASEPHFDFGLLAYQIGDVKTGDAQIAEAARLGRVAQTPDEMVALANFVGDYDHNYSYAIELYKNALSILTGLPRNQAQSMANIRLKLAVAYYFNKDYANAKQTFLELRQEVNLKSLPIYAQLKPVLEQLNIQN